MTRLLAICPSLPLSSGVMFDSVSSFCCVIVLGSRVFLGSINVPILSLLLNFLMVILPAKIVGLIGLILLPFRLMTV